MVDRDLPKSEWQTIEHILAYLAKADRLLHRTEGEKALLDQIFQNAKRVLDLGTADGRLLALIKLSKTSVEGVALDFSDPMLEHAQKRFVYDKHSRIVKHDFSLPLPLELDSFDAVVSSLAIHYLKHPRKKQLYTEMFSLLNPRGEFCNIEHVSSATENLLEILSNYWLDT
jgi:tRNA (cmo5U34)-methyltransferase